MYIKYKKNSKVVELGNGLISQDLIPEIVKENVSYSELGESGPKSLAYEINMFCPVNLKNFVKEGYPDIEVRLSSFSAKYYRKKITQNILEAIENRLNENDSPETAELIKNIIKSKDLLKSITRLSNLYNLDIRDNLLSQTKLITQFSMNEDIEKILSEPIKVMETNRIINNEKINFVSSKSQKTFTSKYNYLIKQGIDPLFMFENSFQKKSASMDSGGLISETGLKLNSYDKYLKEIFEDIVQKIDSQSSEYKTKIVKKIPNHKILSSRIKISKEKLESLGQNIHLLYIVKQDGLNLQVESFPVSLDDIYEIRDLESIDYQMFGTRNKYSGVTKLGIGNKTSKNCSIDIHAKKIENRNIVNTPFDLIRENLILPPRSKIGIYDGSDSFKESPDKFGITKDIMYRGTLNFKGEKYDNAKTAFSKGIKTLDDAYLACSLIAIIKDESIELKINNIPEGIKACRILKKIIPGSNKKYNPINNGEYTFVEDFDGLSIKDTDVFDGKTYSYIVEGLNNNGENVKLTSNNCIVMYEKRMNAIKINNLRYVDKFVPGNSESSGLNVPREVRVMFSISRKSPDFESILTEIFGKEIRGLFEQELKDLRRLESYIYSMKIERIDANTGEIVQLESIQFSTQPGQKINSRLQFDDTISISDNVYYKITPRYKPTAELIEIAGNIVATIADTNPSIASEVSSRDIQNKIVSRITNKYYTDASIRRGLIISENSRKRLENIDLFYDSSTGDVSYLNIKPLSNIKSLEDLELKLTSIKKIRNRINTSHNIRRKNKTIGQNIDYKQTKTIKDYYSLSFNANQSDFFVDYYIVFIKEGQNIYLDGAIHSRDDYKSVNNYNYLIKHEGTKGIVEYYLVPVSKKGIIAEPVLIGNKLI